MPLNALNTLRTDDPVDLEPIRRQLILPLPDRIRVEHHFGGKIYIKSVYMEREDRLMQHAHEYDHQSVVVYGHVMVGLNGKWEKHIGGDILLIPAGTQHEVKAITDCLWLCVHATDETDPNKVDDVLIQKHL